eukprot:1407534-Pyramimonas_sp.AAC.1
MCQNVPKEITPFGLRLSHPLCGWARLYYDAPPASGLNAGAASEDPSGWSLKVSYPRGTKSPWVDSKTGKAEELHYIFDVGQYIHLFHEVRSPPSWNQSQGTREHISGVGAYSRGLESTFLRLEPIAGSCGLVGCTRHPSFPFPFAHHVSSSPQSADDQGVPPMCYVNSTKMLRKCHAAAYAQRADDQGVPGRGRKCVT